MDERRASPRIRPSRTLITRLFEMNDSSPQAAVVEDISREGVGLVCQRPLHFAGLISLELPGTSGSLLARVTHAAVQSDGVWRAGVRVVDALDQEAVEAVVK